MWQMTSILQKWTRKLGNSAKISMSFDDKFLQGADAKSAPIKFMSKSHFSAYEHELLWISALWTSQHFRCLKNQASYEAYSNHTQAKSSSELLCA